MAQRTDNREKRKRRIRAKVSGSSERPRMTVFRSLGHMYVQVIDDVSGRTLAAVSSLKKGAAKEKKTERAAAVGQAIAEACQKLGIKQVVFDRNGYLYHGRVKAVAEGARKGGLTF